jgi:hypothetical protein
MSVLNVGKNGNRVYENFYVEKVGVYHYSKFHNHFGK